MLGALEVKIVARLARQFAEWRPAHTAVMYCLLAHRSLRADKCWPEQDTIAKSCAMSGRAVRRVIADFRDWGVLGTEQIKAVSSRKFGPAQYVFHFNLPHSVDESGGPTAKTVGQNRTGNKEEAKRSKASNKGAPQFSQTDFDERDWRLLQRQMNNLSEACVGSSTEDGTGFRKACERAGISTRRGKELYKKMLA